MDFSVSINEQTRTVFFEPIFQKYPDLEKQIISDFTNYKKTGNPPDYFGRDAPYVVPETAFKIGLMHIHLCFPPNKFTERVQYHRVCKNGGVDACLVYVGGSYNIQKYSLIAIFSPNAHDKARDKRIMNYICRVAKEFHDEN